MPSIALRWSSVRVSCFTTLGLFHHCPPPPAPPNAPSMGGLCCPNPGPAPCPPDPCALARPPAIRTPATAKAKRAIFMPFIDLSSPCIARNVPLSPSLSRTPSFLLRSVVVHQLRQRLHRCRN